MNEKRPEDIVRFVDYVYNFYGPNGVYPMKVNKANILAATELLLQQYAEQSEYEFEGDSIDRERVRDIMIDIFDLSTVGVF